MKPKKNRSRFTVVTATLVLASFGATACSSSPERVATPPAESVTTDSSTETTDTTDGDALPRVLSAEEGAAARGRQGQYGSSATAASDTKLAGDSSVGECGVYEPTQADIDVSNADTEALVAEFVRFGVTHERSVDATGYVVVDYDYDDVVAQSVADSFWSARYPPEPIPQEDIDANTASNDVIANELEAAGVDFTRSTDESGWESIEYDYDDPAAQAAVDAAWLIISPPQPPSAEELATLTEENARIIAAFDAAAIEYELVSDELGWAWVEWDYEDESIGEQVNSVFAELYPAVEIDPGVECASVDQVAVDDVTIEGGTVEGGTVAVETQSADEPATDVVTDPAVEEPVVDPDSSVSVGVVEEFTPEQIAVRDAEITALADGFSAAGVTAEVIGDSPWQTVVFDIANDASVAVVAGVLAERT
jgi:hypothetical protein